MLYINLHIIIIITLLLKGFSDFVKTTIKSSQFVLISHINVTSISIFQEYVNVGIS